MLPMAIMAGAQLASGLLGSRAARQAAETQAAAQREAAQLQLRGVREGNQLVGDMYRNNINLQAPQLRGGQTALSALMSGMGLGPLQMQQQQAPSGDVGNERMFAGGGGGQVTGGYLDANGLPYQGPTQTNAQGQVVGANGQPLVPRQGFDAPAISQEQADSAASPYAGTFLEKFTGQDLYRDPSYQFRLSEGEKLMRARQAAGGNRFSGQAMKDIADYGQQAASQEYQGAYARFMDQKRSLYERLSGIAGTAAPIASNLGQQGQGAASTMAGNIQSGYRGAGENFGNAGTATAGGIVGSTNALVSGINGAGNTWLANDYFNKINNGRGYAGGMTGFYGGNGTGGD